MPDRAFVPCWLATEFASPELRPFPHLLGLGCAQFGTANRALAPHRHDGIELHYIHRGRYRWMVGGRAFTAKEGDAFLTCPWHLHGSSEGVQERGAYAWVIIAPRAYPRSGGLDLGPWSWLPAALQRRIGGLLPQRHLLPRADAIGALIGEAIREVLSGRLGHVERANAVLSDLLLNAARAIEEPAAGEAGGAGIATAIEGRVRGQPDRAWTVAELCTAVRLDATRLRRALHREVGLTPRAFVLQIRIEEAIARMASGWPLQRIALACGFASHQHFTTAFRKAVGQPPSAWLAGRRSGPPG